MHSCVRGLEPPELTGVQRCCWSALGGAAGLCLGDRCCSFVIFAPSNSVALCNDAQVKKSGATERSAVPPGASLSPALDQGA